MALDTVTLQWDLTDLIESGLSATLSITPTAQMSDPTDHKLIPPVARTYTFTGGTGQLAGIIANDDANILPAYNPPDSPGTGYLISVTASNGQVIVPQFQTQLLTANAVDGVLWLDELVAVPVVATSYQYLPLTTGAPPAEGEVPVFTGVGYATTPGTPARGTVTSVNDVEPADGNVTLTAADVGAASTGALSSEVTRAETAEGTLGTAISTEISRAETAEGTLSTAISTETTRAEAAEAARMPLPSGTPSAGQLPAATGTGEASAWTTPSAVSSVTLTVAASNSTAKNKAAADYVCTGANDDATISAACAAVPSVGGKVALLAGDYHYGATSASYVTVGVSGTTLEGQGRFNGALIHVPASYAAPAAVKVTAALSCTIRDLCIVFDDPAGISAYGIWTVCNEPHIRNVEVQYSGGHGFVIDGPAERTWNGVVDDCTALYPGSGSDTGDGFYVTDNAWNCVLTNCFTVGGTGSVASGQLSPAGLLTTALTSGSVYTSLAVAGGIQGPVAAGDQIIIDSPAVGIGASTIQVVTASSSVEAGATSIPVDSFTANANYAANWTLVADKTQMPTRYGFNIAGPATHLENCHGYRCYESALVWTGAPDNPIFVMGGEYETCGWVNVNLPNVYSGVLNGIISYGAVAYAAVRMNSCQWMSVGNNWIDGSTGIFGFLLEFSSHCTVTNNVLLDAVGANGICALFDACDHCAVVSNETDYWISGSPAFSFAIWSCTNCIFEANSANVQPSQITGTLTGTIATNNIGIPYLGDPNGAPGNPAADLVATTNITTSGSQTVDGISTGTRRVLCTAQSTASANGIWLANTSGAWTRPPDFASGVVLAGRTVQVVSGTSYAGTLWELMASTSAPVTIDTSSQAWQPPNHYPAIGTTYSTPLGSSGALTADSAVHTLLTTASIPVGRYLCTATITVEGASADSAYLDFGVALGTAVGTIVGTPAGALSEPSSSTEFIVMTGTVSCVVNVTTAGTVALEYYLTGVMTVLAGGVSHNFGSSTGIALVSI